MTKPKTQHLLLASCLLSVPALAVGQPEWVEIARDLDQAAAGTAVFVIILAAVVMLFGTIHAKFKRDLFARFVDKGQEIPVALLPRPPSRERELRRGIWLTSLGLGVGFALFLAGGPRAAAWCLILLFLAAASFLNAVLFYRDDSGRQK
jgi:hypothetical protein